MHPTWLQTPWARNASILTLELYGYIGTHAGSSLGRIIIEQLSYIVTLGHILDHCFGVYLENNFKVDAWFEYSRQVTPFHSLSCTGGVDVVFHPTCKPALPSPVNETNIIIMRVDFQPKPYDLVPKFPICTTLSRPVTYCFSRLQLATVGEESDLEKHNYKMDTKKHTGQCKNI